MASCYTGSATPGDGGDPDGPGCPNDLPASCPGTPPSYPTEIAPIITTRCASCHGPGGESANRDFTTYDGIFAERTTILTQVYSCRMPPAGAPAVAPSERAALLAWLVCGAPSQ
jgi:mono/diheme cytochrome c family protein